MTELKGSLEPYSCYYNPPINLKLFKLINEDKINLKRIKSAILGCLLSCTNYFLFSVSMDKMWCRCSLFFRGRNAMLLLFWWLFWIYKWNSKNLVLGQHHHIRHWLRTTSIYFLQFTATALSNWNLKAPAASIPCLCSQQGSRRGYFSENLNNNNKKKNHIFWQSEETSSVNQSSRWRQRS